MTNVCDNATTICIPILNSNGSYTNGLFCECKPAQLDNLRFQPNSSTDNIGTDCLGSTNCCHNEYSYVSDHHCRA